VYNIHTGVCVVLVSILSDVVILLFRNKTKKAPNAYPFYLKYKIILQQLMLGSCLEEGHLKS
jgi:hypothetical protein